MDQLDAMLEWQAKRLAEMRELERTYGRSFLESSLHEAGVRWRGLQSNNFQWWLDRSCSSSGNSSRLDAAETKP